MKKVARLFLKYRGVLERAKYRGATILDEQTGNDYLSDSFGKPYAVGRFGASELGGMVHYLAHGGPRGHCASWGHHRTMLHRNAGVYPSNPEILSRFCQVYLEALGQLDVLGVWFRPGENYVRKQFTPQAKLLGLCALEPYYHERPWSRQLAGKRVLVVSPFAETIQAQYRRRHEVWRARPEMLPDFQLRTVRVPLSAALISPEYPDWFSGLAALRSQMATEPFDVAIVGAGAWSLLSWDGPSFGCGSSVGGRVFISSVRKTHPGGILHATARVLLRYTPLPTEPGSIVECAADKGFRTG